MHARNILTAPNLVLPSPAPPPAFAALTRYDSGWVQVQNQVSRNLEFTHQLGVIPTQVALFFSPDRELVFPLPASWNSGNTSNPVSVWLTVQALTMSIAAGYPLHSLWDARTTAWTHWEAGHFRVFLNP